MIVVKVINGLLEKSWIPTNINSDSQDLFFLVLVTIRKKMVRIWDIDLVKSVSIT